MKKYTSKEKYTFENVMKILAKFGTDRRFTTFSITGYTHLETIAVLHYADRDEIVKLSWGKDKFMDVEFYYAIPFSENTCDQNSYTSKKFTKRMEELQDHIEDKS